MNYAWIKVSNLGISITLHWGRVAHNNTECFENYTKIRVKFQSTSYRVKQQAKVSDVMWFSVLVQFMFVCLKSFCYSVLLWTLQTFVFQDVPKNPVTNSDLNNSEHRTDHYLKLKINSECHGMSVTDSKIAKPMIGHDWLLITNPSL